jgi:hypothetical protein
MESHRTSSVSFSFSFSLVLFSLVCGVLVECVDSGGGGEI